MDFKLDDAPKAPTAHQLAPSRKAGRQDWELQPTDGFSTPAELYLKAVPDDSSSDGGDGEDTYAALQIGDELPHFKAASTNEKAPVDSREYGENQWLVIVTFCRTYDPVATSELTSLAELQKDFGERRIKILGLAVNTKTTIEKWVSATEELSDVRVEFPIVADSDAVIASTIGMVRHGQPPHPTGVLHASMVLIVNPNNRVEIIQQYPESVGRNFHEVLRAVDALNMTFLHTHVSTGGNWASGEDVVIGAEINPNLDTVSERYARPYIDRNTSHTPRETPNCRALELRCTGLHQQRRRADPRQKFVSARVCRDQALVPAGAFAPIGDPGCRH